MGERKSQLMSAGSVMFDLTESLNRQFPLGAPNINDSQSEGLQLGSRARNVALLLVAKYIGEARMFAGALYLSDNGGPINMHHDKKTLGNIINIRKERAQTAANLACALCLIKSDCGIGPEVLSEKLQSKRIRTRFRNRLRRNMENTRYCATNLAPERLRKSTL